jgi:hypothetical protein
MLSHDHPWACPSACPPVSSVASLYSQDLKRLLGIRAPPPGSQPLHGSTGGKGSKASKDGGKGKGGEKVTVTVVTSGLTQTKEVEVAEVRASARTWTMDGGTWTMLVAYDPRYSSSHPTFSHLHLIPPPALTSQVGECEDVDELVSTLSELFPAALRDTPKHKLLLQCRPTAHKDKKALSTATNALFSPTIATLCALQVPTQ